MRNIIKEVEKELQKYGFLKCNQCYLVNPRFIISVKGKELLAQALSHEIDHLNGEVFVDKIVEGTLEYVDPNQNQSQNKNHFIHTETSFFTVTKSLTPSMDSMETRSPAGMTDPSALRAVQVLPST